MPIAVTTGTREEPVEVPLAEGETANWTVLIDGEKKHFFSAHAYAIWAGKSLVLPLAPKLEANLPADYLVALSDDSEASEEETDDDDFYNDTAFAAGTTANWGSDDEDY